MSKSKKTLRKRWPNCLGVVVRGRLFTQKDLVSIRRLIRRHPNWGRTKISFAASRLLGWRQQNGRLKDRACRVALVRLEALGYLELPRKRVENGGKRPTVNSSPPEHSLCFVTKMPSEVRSELVRTPSDAQLWNDLVAHFHYLGLATPVGRLLRYLIYGDAQLLGAISFGEPAWNIRSRDALLEKVGVNVTERTGKVVANNRFLILPNVQVPNLASRVLAESLRAMRKDWVERYAVAPLVVETFVDPCRFDGTCYRASNWLLLGTTKGFSKRGACHTYANAPKLLFVKGLLPLIHSRMVKSLSEHQRAAA